MSARVTRLATTGAIALVVVAPLIAAPAAHAKIVTEDEDGKVQMKPVAGQRTGWGSGATNQVISSKGGTQVGNRLTAWLTVYGLTPNRRYELTVAKGRSCAAEREPVSGVETIRTNSYGGWQGKARLSIRKPAKWVVRGQHRLDVSTAGGQRVACGRIMDDPDIGN